MDSGGDAAPAVDAVAIDAAAIVTTVDSSIAITSSIAHGGASSETPVVSDDKKPKVPELSGAPIVSSTEPLGDFDARVARHEASDPHRPTTRREPALGISYEVTGSDDIEDEKTATVQEHVAAIEETIEGPSNPASPRRIFSHSMWGGIKGMKGIHVDDLHVPNVGDFKIPNVDINIDGYFVGPRAMEKHSKWPTFMRLHGSITPRMMLPMFVITLWSIIVTAISKHTKPLGVSSILLTILGFVVGLSLSFRGSTAYERYMEGRKAWATLTVQSRNLARYIWVHVQERNGEEEAKEDLVSKITAINLIYALAVSVKHQLRFEPYTYYPDLVDLVGHLDTFAKAAEHPGLQDPERPISKWKAIGEYLGVNMATSNPRKALKRAIKPVGNLPYEIMLDMSAYFEMVINNGTMSSTIIYGQVCNAMATITDTIATANRVLATPLPIGYVTLISQIVILYVYLLPFQLFPSFGWNTIPATMAAAYIIIGLEAMGSELENPFGNNVNDLPLDNFCDEIRRDLDVVMSQYRADGSFVNLMKRSERVNKLLWPLSNSPEADWKRRSREEIMNACKAKVVVGETRRLSAERVSEERAAVILPV